jgi:aspartate aminotransferase
MAGPLMPTVPSRTSDLPRSGIRVVMDLAWASPEPILRLEAGQPDVAPPDHVLDAMRQAIASKETGYTPNAGLARLREACSAKLDRVNDIHRPPEQVFISTGSTEGLMSAVLCLCEPGDEVLIPDPGWPTYTMACRLASVRSVPYPLRSATGYRPAFDEIEALVSERTRIVVVNSPSNPLGVVWDVDVMRAWVELAEHHDLWILSDECYDEIVFGVEAISPAAVPGGDERVVTAHSFSKTYAMTGLRVGYVSGPLGVIQTLIKMQEALVACVNGPAQHGAIAALEGPQDFVIEMLEQYRRRRDLALSVAEAIGLPHVVPHGAFYLWVPLGSDLGDTTEFCRRLIRNERVAVAPGETFGTRGIGSIRISLAASEEVINEGMTRIASFVRTLRPD